MRKRAAGIAVVTATALVSLGLGCSDAEQQCAFGSGPEEICQHDLAVGVSGFSAWMREEVFIDVRCHDDRHEDAVWSIDADAHTFHFRDCIWTGGGPYEIRVFLDIDDDEDCDVPPTDSVWLDSAPGDETDVYVAVRATDMQATTCVY